MNPSVNPADAGPSLWPLAVFVGVLVLIPLVLWALRRSGLGGRFGAPGLMRPVSALALSPTQRLMVVEVGQGARAQWLVLGVSADRIQHLATLEPQPAAALAAGAAAGAAAPTVQALIDRWRQGRDPQEPS
ncbi:FliO/MopB family protein [Ideonella livida]|uniref:FliO/MopB family protein n=1 Tax=Ideonella livida TaxID=2707176 RepID=A0A7C9PI64_9BURK|nr:flagellar biosynthetic protein FliO [Ideonella livida]NDY92429.1 FliO/MopB family protein [Ideonella livida]